MDDESEEEMASRRAEQETTKLMRACEISKAPTEIVILQYNHLHRAV